MHSGSVIRQCSVACGHFVWQLTVFVWIRNHSKTTQDSAKMCVPVLMRRITWPVNMSSASGGLCPLTPQQWPIKMGAAGIENWGGPWPRGPIPHRYVCVPYCTKFDRLTNRKFMEIVGTRGQILMAKCTKIDFGPPSAPMAPRPSRLRRSSRRLRRLDPSLSRLRRSAAS